jgi:hypothetical protein
MSYVGGEVPMKRSDTSPLSIAAIAFAYMAGVITVAVLCCDDVILPGEIPYANASPLPPASESDMDGGRETPVLSGIAFVFYEEIEDIAGVTSSVHVGDSELVLENTRLYRVDGALVVETQAETDKDFRPHFYFLNRENEVVKEYRAYLTPNRSLITYYDLHFGQDEQLPYHNLPQEFQAAVGENTLTLESENRLWVDDRFVDLWQVVHLPDGSQASASNCNLVEIDQPSKLVGVTSDGTSGETVTLEVLP